MERQGPITDHYTIWFVTPNGQKSVVTITKRRGFTADTCTVDRFIDLAQEVDCSFNLRLIDTIRKYIHGRYSSPLTAPRPAAELLLLINGN